MLPKIEHPIYKIKIPSLQKNYNFRPLLVKEEKILLMAKESKNNFDIFVAIKQIVTNCCVDVNLDINKLAVFDLEYIFLKIRCFSVDSIVKISYKDQEDNQIYDFEIDLNEIEVIFPSEKNDKIIKITKNVGLILKYPSASLYEDKEFFEIENNHYFELILKCLDKIYEDEDLYEIKDIPRKELETFVENLNIDVFKKVNEFLINTPKIHHVIKYENKKGTKREIFFNSLNDFFTWR